MNAIRQLQKLNQRELDDVVPPEGSWHRDYSDTAFIYIGGLPFELSEGDVITIFSQYGEPVFINLVRDKETGKSKGFCFIKYEDQRSCDLAVDNLSGATIMGRMLNVDHTRYKRKDDEEIFDNTMGQTGPRRGGDLNGGDAQAMSDTESEVESRPMLKEERELAELMKNEDDDDPMKAYMIKQKQDEVEVARLALVKRERKPKDGKHKRHKSHRSRKHEYSESDLERRERRRRKRHSRSPGTKDDSDSGRPSIPRRRDRSATPVYDQDTGKRRSASPARSNTGKPGKLEYRRRARSRSRSRTPVYRSRDGHSRQRRDQSTSRERRK